MPPKPAPKPKAAAAKAPAKAPAEKKEPVAPKEAPAKKTPAPPAKAAPAKAAAGKEKAKEPPAKEAPPAKAPAKEPAAGKAAPKPSPPGKGAPTRTKSTVKAPPPAAAGDDKKPKTPPPAKAPGGKAPGKAPAGKKLAPAPPKGEGKSPGGRAPPAKKEENKATEAEKKTEEKVASTPSPVSSKKSSVDSRRSSNASYKSNSSGGSFVDSPRKADAPPTIVEPEKKKKESDDKKASKDEEKKPAADGEQEFSSGPVLCANCVELIDDDSYAKNKDGICLHHRCVEAWKYKKKASMSASTSAEDKPPVGECSYCKQSIPTGVAYMRSKGDSGILLHERCVEDWKISQKPKEIICNHCKKPIEGEYVELTNPFGEKFFLHKGECAEEFQKSVAPTCHSCKKPITGEGVQIGDKSFHKECQSDYDGTAPKCAQCNLPCVGAYLEVMLPGGKDKVPVHEKCADEFREKNAAKCAKCGEPIKESTVSKIKDEIYHTKCAEEYIEEQKNKKIADCAQCGEPILAKSKYLQGGDDLFLHEECEDAYQDAVAPKCGYCGKNITGAYVDITRGEGDEAETISYHEECYDKKKGEELVEEEKQKREEEDKEAKEHGEKTEDEKTLEAKKSFQQSHNPEELEDTEDVIAA